jgi:fructose-1-phosphate kinase PfkB-like protein
MSDEGDTECNHYYGQFVGAGDIIVAGTIFPLKGKSLLEAAKFGVARCTAATTNAGTELCK